MEHCRRKWLSVITLRHSSTVAVGAERADAFPYSRIASWVPRELSMLCATLCVARARSELERWRPYELFLPS